MGSLNKNVRDIFFEFPMLSEEENDKDYPAEELEIASEHKIKSTFLRFSTS